MRYDDWDILLFPKESNVPIKEFKTACYVVQDTELSHTHGSFGIPTVTCFVPSLAAGTPFQVSIHSWNPPIASPFTQSYTKYIEDVKFEARLLVDGRLVASTFIGMNSGPHVIWQSLDFRKTGELEPLRFPSFREEVAQQNYWSPADELGRIKVIISEGFARDSMTMPFERVKNVVAFAFQHAPLGTLESSAIAWPNSSMWQQASSMLSAPIVQPHSLGGAESHSHSPRRHVMADSSSVQTLKALENAPGHESVVANPFQYPTMPDGTSQLIANANDVGSLDQLTAYMDWRKFMEYQACFHNLVSEASMGQGHTRSSLKSNTDISMPDYVSSNRGSESDGNLAGQLGMPSFLQNEEDLGSSHSKAPTNTPTATWHAQDFLFADSRDTSLPPELVNSLTHSLLNQPTPCHGRQHPTNFPNSEVMSRKEARFIQQPSLKPSATIRPDHCEMRKVSQQMYIPSGTTLASGNAPSQTNTPRGSRGPSGQRALSIAESGPCFDTENQGLSPLRIISGNTIDKGTKRIRNLTPASAKAIDDADEPRRLSPRVRFTPFVEDVSLAE